MRIRKNIKNLSPDENQSFTNAVLTLKNKPSLLHTDDTTKNRYDDYVEVHLNAMMAMSMTDPNVDPHWYPGWAHNGPAFFPWHRQLLLEFENDLQAVNTNVTIPYWDWTDDSSFPFTDDFMGSDGDPTSLGNPEEAGKVVNGPFAFDGANNWKLNVKDEDSVPDFLQRGFGRMSDVSNLPTASEGKNALAPLQHDNPPWKLKLTGFHTQVEYRLHNLVHRWVNGTMMLAASPNDPLFWLHHANVDRIWAIWQRQHSEVCPYVPTFGGPVGHSPYDLMIFNSDPPFPWPATNTPASVLDHHVLGYRYDSEPQRTWFHVPQSIHDILTRKHIVPNFLLLKTIDALTRKKAIGKKQSNIEEFIDKSHDLYSPFVNNMSVSKLHCMHTLDY